MDNINFIKYKAKYILEHTDPMLLEDEEDVFDKLDRIINTDKIEIHKDNKLLDEIRAYLLIKEKIDS